MAASAAKKSKTTRFSRPVRTNAKSHENIRISIGYSAKSVHPDARGKMRRNTRFGKPESGKLDKSPRAWYERRKGGRDPPAEEPENPETRTEKHEEAKAKKRKRRNRMTERPLQDRLPEGHGARVCYGCGADNANGLRIKSRMEGEQAVCRFTPEPHHQAFPGILNGGVIATVLDCHAIWTAVGVHLLRHNPGGLERSEAMFMTRKLTVEYLKPTPVDRELLIRGRVTKEGERSSVVEVELYAGEKLTARGEALAVRAEG